VADIQPRHPTTGRGWNSRNLRCTSCSDVVCPCCGRACCSFKARIMIAGHELTPAEGRAAALKDISAIAKCFPVGRESPTFIQCTHQTGCGRLVCPDCCGMCPDACCQDIQCRVGDLPEVDFFAEVKQKCKTQPWGKCDWHPDSDARLKNAAQRRTTPQQSEHDEEVLPKD